MSEKSHEPKKFIVFVEYNCDYAPWGKKHMEDFWAIREYYKKPQAGEDFNDFHCYTPSELCDEPDARGNLCNSKGKITKIEEYSPFRAKELGVE
jgi:hypothetical protein